MVAQLIAASESTSQGLCTAPMPVILMACPSARWIPPTSLPLPASKQLCIVDVMQVRTTPTCCSDNDHIEVFHTFNVACLSGVRYCRTACIVWGRRGLWTCSAMWQGAHWRSACWRCRWVQVTWAVHTEERSAVLGHWPGGHLMGYSTVLLGLRKAKLICCYMIKANCPNCTPTVSTQT